MVESKGNEVTLPEPLDCIQFSSDLKNMQLINSGKFTIVFTSIIREAPVRWHGQKDKYVWLDAEADSRYHIRVDLQRASEEGKAHDPY